MEKTLEREGIAPQRIEVIPNWSDGELIKPVPLETNELRARWNFRPDDVVVGYVGNFGRVHDFDTILEAISLHQQRAKLAPARRHHPQHRLSFGWWRRSARELSSMRSRCGS